MTVPGDPETVLRHTPVCNHGNTAGLCSDCDDHRLTEVLGMVGLSMPDPADQAPPLSDEAEKARIEGETQLSLAMVRLGGEGPAQVYDEAGYSVWVAAVTKAIQKPLVSALAAERAKTERLEKALNKVGHQLHEFRQKCDPGENEVRVTVLEMFGPDIGTQVAALSEPSHE